MKMSIVALCAFAGAAVLAADCEPVITGEAFGACRRVAEVPRTATCLQLVGTTLFCGADHGIYVFDVSKPQEPRLRGVAEGVGKPRQLVHQNGYVYVATRETGLWVVDARDLDHPKVLTRFDTIELATGIDVAGDVLFVGQRQNGVEFIDISDPAHPAHIRVEKTSESQSVVYRDGWLYSGDWGAGEITTIDAHDMAMVRKVDIAKLKGFGDGVALFGKWLFAATGHHYQDRTKPKEETFGKGHGLEILDVSNPVRPTPVSRVAFDPFYVIGNDFWTPRPSADGKTVFVADTHNGLYAVDYAVPEQPRQIGRLLLPPDPRAKAGLPGKCVSYVAVGQGVVYFTALEYGLGVVEAARAQPATVPKGVPPKNAGFRIDYPTAPTSRFSAWQPQTRAQARGAAACGDYLYAACGAAGLYALTLAEDGTLREVKRFAPAFSGDVKVKGNRLYSAEGLDGFAIYDISDPLAPKELQRCRDLGVAANCALWTWAPKGKYYVVSNRENGYIWLNEALKPVFKCSRCPGWDRYLADDVVGEGLMAMSHANTGFSWIDQSGAKPKARLASPNRGGGLNGNSCVFRGGRLLRVFGSSLLYLEPGEMERPEAPWQGVKLKPVGKKGNPPRGQPAWDGANRLVLTARIDRKVWLVDISDEKAPQTLWEESVPGQPDAALYFKGRVVVPCGYQGVLVARVARQ